jgi:hypothetical protein
MSTAPGAIKRRSVQAAASADMKHVMPALAVARQLDFDAEERIGILEYVELQAHGCYLFTLSGASFASELSCCQNGAQAAVL